MQEKSKCIFLGLAELRALQPRGLAGSARVTTHCSKEVGVKRAEPLAQVTGQVVPWDTKPGLVAESPELFFGNVRNHL